MTAETKMVSKGSETVASTRYEGRTGGKRTCGAATSRLQHFGKSRRSCTPQRNLDHRRPVGRDGNLDMETTRGKEPQVTSFPHTASIGSAVGLVANSILEMRLAHFKAVSRDRMTVRLDIDGFYFVHAHGVQINPECRVPRIGVHPATQGFK